MQTPGHLCPLCHLWYPRPVSLRPHMLRVQWQGRTVSLCTEAPHLGLPRWLSGKESTCRCRRQAQSPPREDATRLEAASPVHHSFCAPVPQSLCSATREAQHHSQRAAPSLQLENSPSGSRDPAQPKINKFLKRYLKLVHIIERERPAFCSLWVMGLPTGRGGDGIMLPVCLLLPCCLFAPLEVEFV